jgi:hypothetical protein
MKPDSYLFDISQATDAGVLIAYLADAQSDATLRPMELEQIKTAISDRFEELAVHHVENNFPKGRWTVERGTARLKPEIEKALGTVHSVSFSAVRPSGQLDPLAENPS